MSAAVTQGIRVEVTTAYQAEQSSPGAKHFVFAYTVRITNEGTLTAQLRSRHWVITDDRGTIQEVRGDGVVGVQPLLKPGQHFEYTSSCVLKTPRGTMHGTYRIVREDGHSFDAEIAPFLLVSPAAQAPRWVN